MAANDDEFLRELQAAFQVEADEHLQAMSSGLLELEKMPAAEQPASLLETVYREAHSLKGASRAVNMTDVETVCQSLETVLAAWKRHDVVPSPGLFDTMHRALDMIGKLLSVPAGGGDAPDKHQITEITHQLDRGAGARDVVGQPEPIPPAAESRPHNGASPPREAPSPEERALEVVRDAVPAAPPRAEAPSPAQKQALPEKSALSETVRISTIKLDELLLQAEEMLVVKQTASQRATELREVQTMLERWQKEWAKISPELRGARRLRETSDSPDGRTSPGTSSRVLEFLDWNHAQLKSLESRMAGLVRAAEQEQRDVGGKVDDLLKGAKKLLMLPFSTLLSIFPKMIRDLARDEGKDVQLVMQGGGVEIDKRILEEMKDPLIHLLRNSVDHGIEVPDERVARGKPARATVALAVAQVGGNEVEILVTDDGAGIDVERVKASAVKHGAVTAEVAGQMDEAQALMLIFQSEVSTSPIITEISGRGLGMAIVREKVEKLGGRIGLETRRYFGTTFRILLPLTLATFKGILVQTGAGGQVFVIPTADVDRVVRVRADAAQTVENRETIPLNGRLVSLVRLDDALELPRQGGVRDEPSFAVVLGTADKRIAFRVDAVLNEQEVLVKSLGPPLRRVRHVAGATVLGSGKAVPILNVADLLKSATSVAAAVTAAVPEGDGDGEAAEKSVLIVEDSITSRMLLKNILESAGYRVATAVDGVDALTTLRTRDFDLVVSDVDMPRMNGFDLTARIREDKTWAEIPVVLVTARDTREDRERGIDVGASAYLVKSSFDQSNLLAVIRRLI
ncbi:MAG: response regulator [Armatimonadetes bacterium]|nr:response regulator [Armatimonadota bacterium]